MFCPNCASANDNSQHYCRTCGLKLDAIVAEMVGQRPSEEFSRLLKRKRWFEKLGILSISISGFLGFCLLLANAFYYKLQFFGPELLFRSATVALLAFALASIFFFNYPKLFMKFDRLNPLLPVERGEVGSDRATTNKLLSDPPFEHASVTEHSTELLKTPK